MGATLVVHVTGDGRHGRALAELAASRPDRHVLSAVDPTADVVVLHGRRAALRARRWRHARSLVVYRPRPGASMSTLDRWIARRCDLLAVRDDRSAAPLRTDGVPVIVVPDDHPATWHDLLDRVLVHDPPLVRDRRPLAGSDRVRVTVTAERMLGQDLLVAAPGPERAVERLTGSGPAIWHLLSEGRTLDEVADALTPSGLDADDEIARAVGSFASQLIDAGLAAPA